MCDFDPHSDPNFFFLNSWLNGVSFANMDDINLVQLLKSGKQLILYGFMEALA